MACMPEPRWRFDVGVSIQEVSLSSSEGNLASLCCGAGGRQGQTYRAFPAHMN